MTTFTNNTVTAQQIKNGSDSPRWNNWKWQIAHTITDIDTVESVLGIKFSAHKRAQLEKTIARFPMRISPYYLSLINTDNYEDDPVFLQSVPCEKELNIEGYDLSDPLAEDIDSPAPGITHRYPDRVLFHVSNLCAMYCRHCTRKRKVGDIDYAPNREELKKGIEYIRATPEVRDVLLSGGDPFLLSDSMIDWLLTEISSIPHVEVIRIGTRTPVVLPQRITPELVDILKKHHPIWINTHFNHPREITEESSEALRMLADAGIPLGNQSVLLARVNDCPKIIKALVHKLVKNRVRPYYIYQCDLSEGLTHFRTSVGKGIEILENLIGHTSGFAVPTYVIDAPGGGGKIPVMPNYVISWSSNKVVLRNYEGVITTYYEPENYKPVLCDEDCANCKLELDLEGAESSKIVGIAQLLADYEKTDSLVPENNARMERRNNDLDTLTTIGESKIQHSKLSDRVFLMRLSDDDMPELVSTLEDIADKNNYGKIFAKVPHSSYIDFLAEGFVLEARVPGMFNGTSDGYFMSKFLDEERKIADNQSTISDVIQQARSRKPIDTEKMELPENHTIRICNKNDIEDMTALYRDIFASYPFPITDSEFILDTMKGNTTYFGVWEGNELIALSSAEQYPDDGNAEMTDFATRITCQQKGLAQFLLNAMEEEMKQRDYKTLYTIARSISYGMNITFAKLGYRYTGTLINNTHIAGRIESMNVWYKNL